MDLEDLFDLLNQAEAEVEAEKKKQNNGNASDSKDNRIHNQRKVINQQKKRIEDLEASLTFRESEVDFLLDDNQSLINDVRDSEDELETVNRRYQVAKKQNNKNKRQLITINHVLNREAPSVAIR